MRGLLLLDMQKQERTFIETAVMTVMVMAMAARSQELYDKGSESRRRREQTASIYSSYGSALGARRMGVPRVEGLRGRRGIVEQETTCVQHRQDGTYYSLFEGCHRILKVLPLQSIFRGIAGPVHLLALEKHCALCTSGVRILGKTITMTWRWGGSSRR